MMVMHLGRRHTKLRHVCYALAASVSCLGVVDGARAEAPFSVTFVKAITDSAVLPNAAIPNNIQTSSLALTAAPGEFEPASLVVRAARDLHNLRIQISDLSSGGATISANNVDLKLVKAWYQGCVASSIHYKGCPGGPRKVLAPELLLNDDALVRVDLTQKKNSLRVTIDSTTSYVDVSTTPDSGAINLPAGGPDLTLPARAVVDDANTLQPVNVANGRNQQFWLTVHVPDNAAAGLYSGTVTLRADAVASQTFPIALQVLPFALQEPMLFYGLFYKGELVANQQPLVWHSTKTSIQYAAEMRDIINHGVKHVTLQQNFASADKAVRDLFAETLRTQLDLGFSKDLFLLFTSKYFLVPAETTAVMNFARQLGYQQIYFFGGDELTREQVAARNAKWSKMRKAGGKIFSVVDRDSNTSELDMGIVSYVQSGDKALADAYRARGKTFLSYGHPQSGQEQSETYRLEYGLALWKNGHHGTMSYTYQHGWGSIWNDFDGYFRDHVFAYPTSHGVIDTVAWEGFREGIDDVRYLTTLLAHIDYAKQHGIATTQAEQLLAGLDITGDLDNQRQRIVQQILNLRQLGSQQLSAPAAPRLNAPR